MVLSSGSREALKWVGLLLMTGDHMNKALLAETAPWLTEAARVVFPIFAVVLASNLTRIEAIPRAFKRLVVAGVLVQPFHALAFGYWLPVNVLLTFAVALGMMRLCGAGRLYWACLLFAVAGLFVDYQWSGVALTFTAWLWLSGRRWALWPFLASLACLCWFNGNLWALGALPLLWWLGRLQLDVPRWRWVFLGYYVAHLVALVALAGLLGGYPAVFDAFVAPSLDASFSGL